MTHFYKTQENEEGVFISPKDCIHMIDCFQPIIKYNIQLIHQIRHKGFYKYVSNEKTYYLVGFEIFNEEKKYFTTKVRKLPQYTNYCYKNIVAL